MECLQADEVAGLIVPSKNDELALRHAELARAERDLAFRERELEEGRPGKLLKLAVDARTLLTEMGMFSVTEQLAIKGLIGRAVALPQGRLALPGPEAEKFYTVAEWLEMEAGHHFNPKDLRKLGTEIAAQFRAETSPVREPDTKQQEVGGRLVNVKAYSNKPVRPGGPTGWQIIELVARKMNLIA